MIYVVKHIYIRLENDEMGCVKKEGEVTGEWI